MAAAGVQVDAGPGKRGALKVSDAKSVVSRNGCSASWLDRPLNDVPLVEGLNEGELTVFDEGGVFDRCSRD